LFTCTNLICKLGVPEGLAESHPLPYPMTSSVEGAWVMGCMLKAPYPKRFLTSFLANDVLGFRIVNQCANLVPRAFPFLSLGSREKALPPGGLLCIVIGQ
jgi:hypothetical protein